MRRGRAVVVAGSLALACGCTHDRDAHDSPGAAAGAGAVGTLGGTARDTPLASHASPGAVGAVGAVAAAVPAMSPASECGHSLCTDNLFVDAAPGAACAVGSVCTLKVTLVATGDFHVNDEYPYRFKADEAKGLAFLGTDEGGKNVFSKGAGDWAKLDPKSGAMTVKFTPSAAGPATIAGVFRLSVCSGATCQLEQSRIAASVAVN